MDGEQLTGVFKNNAGEVISFQTSSGRVISYRKALMEAEAGRITGVSIKETETDEEFALPYEIENISSLPESY
ncbi:hypothetical protein WQ57_13100 [Mesobacillus campisalis]|uniref:DUF3892 domain-containing protein n=1 Tax=Mesobacillus campisalis TaxID=1408103 RepID=A0A0M2SU41_9BACI|nr:DUF3892 domain-containing protein [Mesobacillus campisalis]KKK37663.1 hypothetical protein WQ57_13100 [Mesobacillus campisalis]